MSEGSGSPRKRPPQRLAPQSPAGMSSAGPIQVPASSPAKSPMQPPPTGHAHQQSLQGGMMNTFQAFPKGQHPPGSSGSNSSNRKRPRSAADSEGDEEHARRHAGRGSFQLQPGYAVMNGADMSPMRINSPGHPPQQQPQPPTGQPQMRRAAFPSQMQRGAAAAAAAAAAASAAVSGPIVQSGFPSPSYGRASASASPGPRSVSPAQAQQQMRQQIQGFQYDPNNLQSPDQPGFPVPSPTTPGQPPVDRAQMYYARAQANGQFAVNVGNNPASMATQYAAGRPRPQRMPVGSSAALQQQQHQQQNHHHQQQQLAHQQQQQMNVRQQQPRQQYVQNGQQTVFVGNSQAQQQVLMAQQAQRDRMLQARQQQQQQQQQQRSNFVQVFPGSTGRMQQQAQPHHQQQSQRMQNQNQGMMRSQQGTRSEMSSLAAAAFAQLQTMFMHLPDNMLMQALRDSGGRVERAAALLSGGSGSNGASQRNDIDMVETVNVGSSMQPHQQQQLHHQQQQRNMMTPQEMQHLQYQQMHQIQMQQQMMRQQQMQQSYNQTTRRDIKAPNLSVREKQALRSQQVAPPNYQYQQQFDLRQRQAMEAAQRARFKQQYEQRLDQRRQINAQRSTNYQPPTLRKRNAKQLKFELGSDDSGDEGSVQQEDEDESDKDGESDEEEDQSAAVYLEINRHESEMRVLHFLNVVRTMKELADMASCNEETAQLVFDARPYQNLEIVRQLDYPGANDKQGKRKGRGGQTRKTAGQKVVDTCIETLEGFSAIDQLMANCENYGEMIRSAIASWGVQADANEGAVAEVKLDNEAAAQAEVPYAKEQPKLLPEGVALKDYQIFGVNWINLMYQKKLSGILADEMGLGKTCQVISFLGKLLESGVPGPHLVVVPASTLENWLREISRFCPALKVEAYYGSQRERQEFRELFESDEGRRDFNVMVTTYQLATGSHDDRSFLKRQYFDVCIYDEGHNLKNSASARYRYLMQLKANFRLLLTGTPLQNNLKELISLLAFVLPMVFAGNMNRLGEIFKIKALGDNVESAILSQQRIRRAKTMMTPFILRRYKKQVLSDLPAKTYRVDYVDLNPIQRHIYDGLLRDSRKALLASSAQAALGAGGKTTGNSVEARDFRAAANTMMQLRKCSNHPMLFRQLYDDRLVRHVSRSILQEDYFIQLGSQLDMVIEDISVMTDFEIHRMCLQYPSIAKYALRDQNPWMDCGKVEHLAKILPEMKARGDRVLLFSQFTQTLDILEKVLDTLKLSYFRLDGSTDVTKRQDMIDQFHDEQDIFVFLLSTKAGGFGINLACANVVIIYDSSFNPHDDKQAEDRAHRVGQKREVQVLRIVTRNTIEEHIQQLAHAKLTLDQSVSGQEVEANGADSKKLEELGERTVMQSLLSTLREEAQHVDRPETDTTGLNDPEAAETQAEEPVVKPEAEDTRVKPETEGTAHESKDEPDVKAEEETLIDTETVKHEAANGSVNEVKDEGEPTQKKLSVEEAYAQKRPIIDSDTEDEEEQVMTGRRRRGGGAASSSASAGSRRAAAMRRVNSSRSSISGFTDGASDEQENDNNDEDDDNADEDDYEEEEHTPATRRSDRRSKRTPKATRSSSRRAKRSIYAEVDPDDAFDDEDDEDEDVRGNDHVNDNDENDDEPKNQEEEKDGKQEEEDDDYEEGSVATGSIAGSTTKRSRPTRSRTTSKRSVRADTGDDGNGSDAEAREEPMDEALAADRVDVDGDQEVYQEFAPQETTTRSGRKSKGRARTFIAAPSPAPSPAPSARARRGAARSATATPTPGSSSQPKHRKGKGRATIARASSEETSALDDEPEAERQGEPEQEVTRDEQPPTEAVNPESEAMDIEPAVAAPQEMAVEKESTEPERPSSPRELALPTPPTIASANEEDDTADQAQQPPGTGVSAATATTSTLSELHSPPAPPSDIA
ncbi:DNA-dependent ATPase fun30 [Savitreella phatthalungensis]